MTAQAPRKPRLLLLCGSRSLADSFEKLLWLMPNLEALVWSLRGSGDILLHGGARGPDVLGAYLASSIRGARVVTYLPNGTRLDTHGPLGRWSDKPVHPLERNTGLVKAAIKAIHHGYEVKVVGVIDTTSPTQGSADTIRKAKAAKLRHMTVSWHPEDEPGLAPNVTPIPGWAKKSVA